LNVPKALGDFLVLNALRQTEGTSIAVTDNELLAAQRQLARSEGIFVCPEGAACFAAVDTLRSAGWLRADETVVVLNTGAGMKYPDAIIVNVPTVAPNGHIPPDQASTTTHTTITTSHTASTKNPERRNMLSTPKRQTKYS